MSRRTVFLDADISIWRDADEAGRFIRQVLRYFGEEQFEASVDHHLMEQCTRKDVVKAARHIEKRLQEELDASFVKRLLRKRAFPVLRLGDDADAEFFYTLAYRSFDAEVYAPRWIKETASPIFVARNGGKGAYLDLPPHSIDELMGFLGANAPASWQT